MFSACNLQGIITAPFKGIDIPENDKSDCPSSQIYTTKSGDTCDSIAEDNRVSSATLYDSNPMLLSCEAPEPGLKLCLPSKCEKLYKVQNSDTCSTVASQTGVSWQEVIAWNSILNQRCSNLQQVDPSWGQTLCVSPPGGAFSSAPPLNGTDGGIGGPGGNGDGYSDTIVDPPAGAALALGTTKNCGLYYVAKPKDTCVVIVTNSHTPSDVFIEVNPSLEAADTCDDRLKAGSAYCLSPVHGWNTTDIPVSSLGHSSPTATVSSTMSSTIRPSVTASSAPGGKISTDGTCGGTSGFICTGSTFGNCCSEYGWCGSLEGHCSAGCQSSFGVCGLLTKTTSIPPSSTPTQQTTISTDGTCGGVTGFICTGSTFGNCCSMYGWCGSTTDHCGTDCQTAFGTCTQSMRRSFDHLHLI